MADLSGYSLPPPALRDSVCCTQALPAVEVGCSSTRALTASIIEEQYPRELVPAAGGCHDTVPVDLHFSRLYSNSRPAILYYVSFYVY